MPSKSENLFLYEYAVVRYSARVEREEFVNVGLLMMCKRRRWIRARFAVNEARIKAMFADKADIPCLLGQLEAFSSIAGGNAPVIGALEAEERFRWLTAVRSACLSTSRPHPGKTSDLDAAFSRLFAELVE